MLGPALAKITAGFILAGTALAPCPLQGKVDVTVKLENPPPPVSTALTAQQLTDQFGRDPDSTLSTDGKWMMSGMTRSVIDANYRASFATHTNTQTGATCFAIDKVEYTIIYKPEIYIASDYKNMGCRYSATMMHERNHVKIDVRTITDFLPPLRDKLKAAAEAIGPQGPYPPAQLESEKRRAMASVADTLKPIVEELVALRRTRQATIDTEASYRRDTALCPGQFPKFDGGK
ncbi:MAG: hypothetical protein ACAH80_11200 [Alphaproteobacteria bacterium]